MVQKTANLDRYDRKLLVELSRNGRASWRDLAERVGLSETPTMRRVRALEAKGVISGYSAIVDEAALGRSISVFISVSLEGQNSGAIATFERAIQASPLIRSCHMMAGDVDYLLRVVVADIAELTTFLDAVLRPLPGLKKISSAFALKAVVERGAAPID